MTDDQEALIINAQEELAELRSDIVSQLGGNATDSYLKVTFLSYIDAADFNLRQALS